MDSAGEQLEEGVGDNDSDSGCDAIGAGNIPTETYAGLLFIIEQSRSVIDHIKLKQSSFEGIVFDEFSFGLIFRIDRY